MTVRLPKIVIFKNIPEKEILIASGQIGYKKNTKIKLIKDKKTDNVYFVTKQHAKYIQNPSKKNEFILLKSNPKQVVKSKEKSKSKKEKSKKSKKSKK